jgi:hypothetical protein
MNRTALLVAQVLMPAVLMLALAASWLVRVPAVLVMVVLLASLVSPQEQVHSTTWVFPGMVLVLELVRMSVRTEALT